MGNAKFTLNALLLVVIIFAAISLFFMVKVVDMADTGAVNDYYPIGDTGVSVRYSTQNPNGLYTGSQNTGVLRLAGSFGFDWGAAYEGSTLYINEYSTTDLGMMLCKLVKVDMNTFTKEVLFKDSMLRGRCASGELVVVSGFMMPSSHPDTNSLCKLYCFASSELYYDGSTAEVLFIDPVTGEVVYSVEDGDALGDGFEARYLERTLEEVKK